VGGEGGLGGGAVGEQSSRMRRRPSFLTLALASVVHKCRAFSAAAVGTGRQTAYARDGILFKRDFLPAADFETVLSDCRSLKGLSKPEKNSLAVGRVGRMLDRNSKASACLTSPAVSNYVARLTGAPVVLSDYPIELRIYRAGAGMEWHRDDALYDEPQCEVVLCLENTSDSHTEWIDAGGTLHSEWTPANSALLVRAGDCGARHRVQPLGRGERTILKLVWHTPGSARLGDFYTHLDSLPGLRSRHRPTRDDASGPSRRKSSARGRAEGRARESSSRRRR
jgi:hypothetical protein